MQEVSQPLKIATLYKNIAMNRHTADFNPQIGDDPGFGEEHDLHDLLMLAQVDLMQAMSIEVTKERMVYKLNRIEKCLLSCMAIQEFMMKRLDQPSFPMIEIVYLNQTVTDSFKLFEAFDGKLKLIPELEQGLKPVPANGVQMMHALVSLIFYAWQAMDDQKGQVTVVTSNENMRSSAGHLLRFVRLSILSASKKLEYESKTGPSHISSQIHLSGKPTNVPRGVVWIVEKMGGAISIDRGIGQATDYHLYFPL